MALTALLIWPFIAIALFAVMTPSRALIATVVIGYLVLPESFNVNLPGLPPYQKRSAIALACLVGLVVTKMRGISTTAGAARARLPGLVLGAIVVAVLASSVLTVATNGENAMMNGRFLKGLEAWDIVAMSFEIVVVLSIYFAARNMLWTETAQRELLIAIVIGGLVYTFLVLFELRMSPQLNRMVYGYFPHSWAQHLRGGGFRPIVFLQHGLWVGMFLLTATIAAFALFRDKTTSSHGLFFLAGAWLFIVLALSRNLGALMIAIAILPFVLFTGRRAQLMLAAGICGAFLVFPFLRQAGLIPINSLLSLADSISPERAASFQFRVFNEDRLIARAFEKPLFGWGGWGRGLIFDDRGRYVSTSDGLWIIFLGARGIFGYLAYFLLMIAPVLFLALSAKRRPPPMLTVGLVMIVAANMIYLVPNSAFSPISWLIVGSLMGTAQFRATGETAETAQATTQRPPTLSRGIGTADAVATGPDRTAPRYTRFADSDGQPASAAPLSRRPGSSPHRRSTSIP